MIRKPLASLLILCFSVILAACNEAGDDRVNLGQSFTLSGYAANGPLDGATVEAFSSSGKRLGSTQTDAGGQYSLQLDVAPPYRVTTSGGQYAGQAYTGSLTAWCDGPVANGRVQCDLTPLNNVVEALRDRGYNLDEAEALLEQRYGQLDDPFTRELRTGQAVPADVFDLAAARTAINNGQNLDAWAINVADWVEDPLNITGPPGTPEYSIALNAGTGGSASPNPVTVLMNEQAVFALAPDTGYHLVSATGCGGALAGSTYTTAPINDITAGNGDCTVTANFALNQYSVSYSAGAGGSLVGSASQTVAHGDSADAVSAVADTGFSFTQWSDGVTTATRTDSNVTGDISVTAQFALNQYTLTYTPGTGGTISGTSPQTVNHGGDGSLVTAVADTGYTFSHWSDGVMTAARTDATVTGDINVTALFTLNEYTLTYSAGAGGSISGTTPQTVNHGSNGSSVTAVADTGYTFVQWSDGVSTATRTDTGVTGDISVSAQFALNEYTLTYSADTGGSITGTSPQTVSHGNDGSSVTAVADTGYTFAQWSDGVSTATRTDTGVTGDINVSAEFTLNEYTLTYSAGTGGSISGTSPQTVSHGNDGTQVSAVPDSGYAFDQWSDGMATADRTDTGVTGDISVTADFVPAVATPGGVTANGGDAEVTVSWNPVSGADSYHLYYATDSSITPANYSSLPGGTRVAGVSSSHTVTGLSNGTAYYFIVSAVQSGVEGNASTTVSAIPEAAQIPWQQQLHEGDLGVTVRGPTLAEVSWATTPGAQYDLYVTNDPNTDLNNYASHGASLELNVTPPFTLSGLTPMQPVYLALEVDGVLSGWTRFKPDVWGVDNGVQAQAVANGVRYVGGGFTSVNRITGAGVALAPEGTGTSHELGFPEVNGVIFTSHSDGAGGWYIGGSFTRVDGQQRMNLAHINSFGELSDWNPGADNTVKALSVANGVVYAGGSFLAVGGGTGTTSRNRLAAFDATGNLLSWSPRVNGTVNALVAADGVIYAGGEFYVAADAAGTTTRNRLAAFDAAGNLLAWNPGANSWVHALSVADGVIYAGGLFTACGGGTGTTTRNRLAAFDTAGNLLPWNPGAGNVVYDLSVDSGVVYAGGGFVSAGGGTGTVARNFLAAFDTAGNLLPWNPGANHVVYALSADNGVVYAGGVFTAAGGGSGSTTRNRLAAFDAAGNILPWEPGANGTVYALNVANGLVYAGGDFTGAGEASISRNRLAAFDANGNLLSWNPGADRSVNALAAANGVIYAGGHFSAVGGGTGSTMRNSLAAFDTAGNVLPWNPGTDNYVQSLAVADGVIYAGGYFSAAGGGTGTVTRWNIAAFDATGSLLPWNPGAYYGDVLALVVADGVIYAGGMFRSAGGGCCSEARDHLAAFDTAGNLLPWNPGANSTVTALSEYSGVIYAGGLFVYSGGGGTGTVGRNSLAAFDVAGNLLPWNPGSDGLVKVLRATNGVIYAGGNFGAVGGGWNATARNHLAAFDTAGNVLPWNPGASSRVDTLTVASGLIYAGGLFTAAGEGAGTIPRLRLATFDGTGTLLDQ